MSLENHIITSVEDSDPTTTTGSSLAAFDLSGDGIKIALAIDANGNAERLSYRSGKDAREFSRDEISVAVSDEGTRATVVLQSGAADGPIVRFAVIVPTVIPNGKKAFKVSAAGLRSTRRSLFGGPRPGPQQSYEPMALTGTVSWTPVDGALGTCRDWHASHDHMPPGPKTLRVTGTCTFPTAGYAVKLRHHTPQGINPNDLLLDRIVLAPSGPVAQVITDVKVRYEEITDVEYTTVTILPGGPSIPVRDEPR
jgi:hypothetical protein